MLSRFLSGQCYPQLCRTEFFPGVFLPEAQALRDPRNGDLPSCAARYLCSSAATLCLLSTQCFRTVRADRYQGSPPLILAVYPAATLCLLPTQCFRTAKTDRHQGLAVTPASLSVGNLLPIIGMCFRTAQADRHQGLAVTPASLSVGNLLPIIGTVLPDSADRLSPVAFSATQQPDKQRSTE